MQGAYVRFFAILLISARGVDATQALYRDVYTGALYDDHSEPASYHPWVQRPQPISAPEILQTQIPYMAAPQSLLDIAETGSAGQAASSHIAEEKKTAQALRNQMKVLKAQLQAQHDQQRKWESIAKHEKEQVQHAVDKITHVSKEKLLLRGARDKALKAATWYKQHAEVDDARLRKTKEAERAAEEQRMRLQAELVAVQDAAKSSKQSLELRMNTSVEELKKQLKETQNLLRAAEAKARAADERSRTIDANAKIAVGNAEEKVRDVQASSDHDRKIMAAEVKHVKEDAHRRIQKAAALLEHYMENVAA